MESAHGERWKAYSQLSRILKLTYFDKKKSESVQAYFSECPAGLRVTISAAIVEDVIGSVFFRTEADEDGEVLVRSKEIALELFEKKEKGNDQDDAGDFYEVKIPNKLRFDLALDHISAGLSFNQVGIIMEQYKTALGNAKLKGMTGSLASNYTRVLVAANLQTIGALLAAKDQWAFSLAADGSTSQGVSFFDLRIRLSVDGVLRNIQLLVVPFFDRHTAVNITKLVCKILDAVSPGWRTRLLSVGSDGENTMTGRHGGVVTLLSIEASNKILRVWCPPHQVDLVVKDATKGADGGDFYKTAHTVSVHLRKQYNLISDMGKKCPKDTTRWLALEGLLLFLLTNRRPLLAHFEERPDQAPTPEWWLTAAGIQPVLRAVSIVYKSLEKKELILSQQKEELDNLVDCIVALVNLRSAGEDDDYEDMPFCAYRFSGLSSKWWVSLDDIKQHISDCGSWTALDFGSLSPNELRDVLVEVADYCIKLVVGISDVKAERDENNDAALSDAPPVMPAQLALIRPSVFNTAVLDEYRVQLKEYWSPEEIDEIEEDHKALVRAFREEPVFKGRLQNHVMKTMFNAAWNDCGGRFKRLRGFVAGLATAFPNTTSVEGDFSIVNWEFSDDRKDLSNLSLAGICQSKQRKLLNSL